MLKANVRYNIDQRLVTRQIKKKVAELERYRIKAKSYASANRIDDIDAMYDKWIKQEREHYAKVRIIRLANTPKVSYVLVYGDVVDAEVTSGTGPFDTLSKARAWFLRGGR